MIDPNFTVKPKIKRYVQTVSISFLSRLLKYHGQEYFLKSH